MTKPIIGISIGDMNGIGTEIILKSLIRSKILQECIPLIIGSHKVIEYYKKDISEFNHTLHHINDDMNVDAQAINIYNISQKEYTIQPGVLSTNAGELAVESFKKALSFLKEKKIDGLVTAPIHKKNTYSKTFPFTGHTEYIKFFFKKESLIMLMVSETMKVALFTEHIALKKVSDYIQIESLVDKIKTLSKTLQSDFFISKPSIAILGLNPHAGDNGLIGKEEEHISKAIQKCNDENLFASGPFSADAFFCREHYKKYDAILAMYHDQGLIPFKSLSKDEGVNFTAGLDFVRTSPDHGVAFDIAGKNIANEKSMIMAIQECIKIIQNKKAFQEKYSTHSKNI